jgi:calcium-dependent protein kinase
MEDDEHVHLVMELCRGGELSHSLGKRHFSEHTVRAACMHAGMRAPANRGN